jgi:hypothetical protein
LEAILSRHTVKRAGRASQAVIEPPACVLIIVHALHLHRRVHICLEPKIEVYRHRIADFSVCTVFEFVAAIINTPAHQYDQYTRACQPSCGRGKTMHSGASN